MESGLSFEDLRYIGICFLVFVSCLCVREFARAWMADRLGDPNPAALGRVTLNPMAHVDPLGSLIVPLVSITISLMSGGFFLFGWAKPLVPNPAFFQNPRRGEVLTALAGPLANLLVGLLGAIIIGFAMRYDARLGSLGSVLIAINVVLAVFNLLPFPPFDGGVLLKHLIGMREEVFLRLAQWSFVLWLLVISVPAFRWLLVQCMKILVGPMEALMVLIAGRA